MALFVLAATLVFAAGPASGARAGDRTPPPRGIAGDWKLVLNSTFSGASLDTSLWDTGWFGTGITGPVNGYEIACYNPSNVSLPGDGSVHLAVTAKRSDCAGVKRSYSGAILSTNPYDGRLSGGFQYRYGVLEARIYVPSAGRQVANWPVVMTLGQDWPFDGEDDIFENLSGVVCSHFHSLGNAVGGTLKACYPSFRPGWHTVAANWEPGSVTWYYDGVEVGRITHGVTSSPMYIVLLNTVDGRAPALARQASLLVSYVRVWRRAAG